MDKIPLLRVLGELGIKGIVNERRGWIDFSCPMAQWTHARGTDRHPSAGANISTNEVSGWHCYSCKQKGTIYHLVGQLAYRRNEDYRPILDFVREQEGSAGMVATYTRFEDIPGYDEDGDPLNSAVYDGIWPSAWGDESARRYLVSRSVSEEAATKMDLMFDMEESRIVFPVRDRAAALWGFTGRTIYETIQPKVKDYFGLPKRKLILGAERWQPGRRVIIVEGLFAYAHLMTLGLDAENNIGALLGSEFTNPKCDIIRLNDGPAILLCDNDPAGDAAIFGSISADGSRKPGGADMLKDHVPVLIPPWPLWERGGLHYGGQHGPGEPKADPDQLTREEIDYMLENTDLYGFEKIR